MDSNLLQPAGVPTGLCREGERAVRVEPALLRAITAGTNGPGSWSNQAWDAVLVGGMLPGGCVMAGTMWMYVEDSAKLAAAITGGWCALCILMGTEVCMTAARVFRPELAEGGLLAELLSPEREMSAAGLFSMMKTLRVLKLLVVLVAVMQIVTDTAQIVILDTPLYLSVATVVFMLVGFPVGLYRGSTLVLAIVCVSEVLRDRIRSLQRRASEAAAADELDIASGATLTSVLTSARELDGDIRRTQNTLRPVL